MVRAFTVFVLDEAEIGKVLADGLKQTESLGCTGFDLFEVFPFFAKEVYVPAAVDNQSIFLREYMQALADREYVELTRPFAGFTERFFMLEVFQGIDMNLGAVCDIQLLVV